MEGKSSYWNFDVAMCDIDTAPSVGFYLYSKHLERKEDIFGRLLVVLRLSNNP